jgi:hypothetical protein
MKQADKRAKQLTVIHKVNANIPQKYNFNKYFLEINEICEGDQISQALSADKHIFNKQPKHRQNIFLSRLAWICTGRPWFDF